MDDLPAGRRRHPCAPFAHRTTATLAVALACAAFLAACDGSGAPDVDDAPDAVGHADAVSLDAGIDGVDGVDRFRPLSAAESVAMAAARPARRIASGFWHSCALDDAGAITCWGQSVAPADLAQPQGWRTYQTGQTEAPAGTGYKAIAAGAFHTCAIAADDTVECWGDDRHGESTPPGSRFTHIAAGVALSCGVRADGSMLCWGRHADTLSLPTLDRREFTQVVVGKSWDRYVDNDVCALRTDGGVECFTSLAPAFDSRPGPFVQIEMASAAVCGLRVDGQVECWRCPAMQCIERDVGQTQAPTGTFDRLTANNVHACARRADTGEVTCWGHRDERLAVPNDVLVDELSAGWFHTCAVDVAGDTRCWGSDKSGAATSPLEAADVEPIAAF